MHLNKKGFTGIEVAIIALAIAAIGYFAIPPTVKAVGTLATGGDKNQKKQIHKVDEQYAMFYKDEKGVFVPAKTPYKRVEYMENFDSEAPKPTLWETLKKWIFLIGIAVIIFPAFGVWLFKRIIDLKNNFAQLVTGIEQAKKTMTPEAVKILETSLSKKTNTDTKVLVKKVKANIKDDDLK